MGGNHSVCPCTTKLQNQNDVMQSLTVDTLALEAMGCTAEECHFPCEARSRPSFAGNTHRNEMCQSGGFLAAPHAIDWLISVVAGQRLQLCCPCPLPLSTTISWFYKINATYYIDNHATQLEIIPDEPDENAVGLVVRCQDVLSVEPAENFLVFFNLSGKYLHERELDQAVVIQYLSSDIQRCCVCFLTDTLEERELFMYMFTLICFSKPMGT